MASKVGVKSFPSCLRRPCRLHKNFELFVCSTLVKIPNLLKRSEILDATIIVMRIAEHAHLVLKTEEEAQEDYQCNQQHAGPDQIGN
mmetsp:Transcript_33854/g.54255  ORF Transcript_33854/g.54255 Transcript_33854/m.54255 type:complete len:87 (-) Transcript_33854:50-310(-)